MSRKRRFSLAVLAAATLLVLGCQPVANTGGSSTTPPSDNTDASPTTPTHTVFGKLVDAPVGTPLKGGVVEFAGGSATSGDDGTYTLDLGESSGTVTGTLCLHGTGYTTYLFEGVSADASKDSKVDFVLPRIDTSGVAKHTLNFQIFEFQSDPLTPTEIPPATPVFFSFHNENGAGWREGKTYSDAHAWPNEFGGESCVVSAYVDLAAVSSMHSFNVIKENVSVTLSSQVVTLNEDLGSEVPMSISGDAATNQATLSLAFPNGVFPVLDLTLDSTAQATLQFSNPNDYEGFWTQSAGATSASSAIAPVATSATLPEIPDLGPLMPPDLNSLAYDSGTLSMDPVDGATGYAFSLGDPSNNSYVAIISTVGPSITLPMWMQAQLAGKTLSVELLASVADAPSFDISSAAIMFASGGSAPSFAMTVAWGGSEDVTF